MERISLKQLILQEVDVEQLDKMIADYFKLQKDLEKFRDDNRQIIKKLAEKDKKLSTVRKSMEKYMIENQVEERKVNKWVVTLKKIAKFKRITPDYKQLYLQALTKVNLATRNILNGLMESHKQGKKAQTKWDMQTTVQQGVFDVFKAFFTKLKTLFGAFNNYKKVASSLPKIK